MTKEDKEERFKRLAESRVNKAMKRIKLVGNLSNKNNYTYTEEQVDKIFKALKEELRVARRRFRDASRGSQTSFEL